MSGREPTWTELADLDWDVEQLEFEYEWETEQRELDTAE